jgi:DNA-binding transcriptional regulator/RsmH inhibitor MraZ
VEPGDPMATQFLGEFEVPVDDKGRIFLPADLRRNLDPEADDTLVVVRGLDQIEDRMIVIGTLDRLEFWQPDAWKQYLQQAEATLEEVAETLDL